MKQPSFQFARLRRLLSLFAFVTLVTCMPTHAQVSDDTLLNRGTAAYNSGDYIKAATYLYAYISRSPSLMANNATFDNQVLNAYNYSVNQLKTAQSDRDSYKSQLAQLQAQMQAQTQGTSSVTSGLGRQPAPKPPLKIPAH